MPPITRRRALQGAVGVLAGLAGCQGEGSSNESPSPTARRGHANVETDPDQYSLRSPQDGPLLWFARPGGDSPTPPDRDSASRRGLVASEETAATLSIADGVDAPDARAFVDETDFDSETLYLEHRTVGECYRLELCYVTWDETDIDTRYGRFLRDHDAACEADASVTEARLTRVPAALDPEQISSYGSGVSSGGCHPPPGRRGRTETANRSTTDATTDGGTR